MLLVTGCAASGAGAGAGANDSGAAVAQAATPTAYPTAEAAARRTATVQRGTVEQTYTFNARWLPRDQYRLSFEISGTIRSVNVRRNDTITAGTLLADYQIEDLESQLEREELDLETALFRLNNGDSGGSDPVVSAQFGLANARIQLQLEQDGLDWTGVANARAGVTDAERALDQAQRAYDNGVSDPTTPGDTIYQLYQSLEDARSRLRSAQTSYFSAAQNYNNARARLSVSENSVLQSEIQLQDAIAGSGQNFEQVQAVRAAQNAVNATREKIAKSTLFAPINGVVLSVDIAAGDQAEAFVSVITIALPDPKEAVADGLPFNDIQRLSVGDLGICRITNPELAVQCVIRDLPLTSNEADTSVRVAATMPEAALGQAVEVEMPLETREGVLWLPPGYIRTFQNRTFVIVLTEEGEFVRDVVVGLRTEEREEIISGLTEGEVVVAP